MTSKLPAHLSVKIGTLKSELEDLQDDWQGEYDDMDDKAQESPAGEALQERIAYIEEAVEGLDKALDNLQSIEDAQ